MEMFKYILTNATAIIGITSGVATIFVGFNLIKIYVNIIKLLKRKIEIDKSKIHSYVTLVLLLCFFSIFCLVYSTITQVLTSHKIDLIEQKLIDEEKKIQNQEIRQQEQKIKIAGTAERITMAEERYLSLKELLDQRYTNMQEFYEYKLNKCGCK